MRTHGNNKGKEEQGRPRQLDEENNAKETDRKGEVRFIMVNSLTIYAPGRPTAITPRKSREEGDRETRSIMNRNRCKGEVRFDKAPSGYQKATREATHSSQGI